MSWRETMCSGKRKLGNEKCNEKCMSRCNRLCLSRQSSFDCKWTKWPAACCVKTIVDQRLAPRSVSNTFENHTHLLATRCQVRTSRFCHLSATRSFWNFDVIGYYFRWNFDAIGYFFCGAVKVTYVIHLRWYRHRLHLERFVSHAYRLYLVAAELLQ